MVLKESLFRVPHMRQDEYCVVLDVHSQVGLKSFWMDL